MNELDVLAAKVHAGDAGAAAKLRRELESRMVPIVRRALRGGAAATPLARRILAEAGRVAPRGWNGPAEERERLIGHVARRVCGSVLDGLAPAPRRGLLETVRA